MGWAPLIVAGKGEIEAATLGAAKALVTSDPTRPLVIHFHGGIVNEADGLALAKRLGENDYAAYDALFLVWKTGPGEVLRANLVQALEEAFAKRLLEIVLRWAAAKLRGGPGKAVGLAPISVDALLDDDGEVRPFELELAAAEDDAFMLAPDEERDFENAVAADVSLGTEVQRLVAPTVGPGGKDLGVAAVATAMDAGTLEEIRAEATAPGKALVSWAVVARKALAILVRVVGRFRSGTHHGLYPTVVEEVAREFYLAAAGRFLWTAIKEQAEGAFAAPGLAGQVLGDLLVARQAAGGSPPCLVAHSAGSIYVSRLLEEIGTLRDAGALPKSYVVGPLVFLAPAATTARFARALRSIGPGSASPVFRRFRMFAMGDPVEQADRVGGVIYPRSLLYVVAGVAEEAVDTPIVGMQRYFASTCADGSKRFDDADTQTVEALVAGNTVWSVRKGGPGLSSSAAKHGDFDNDPDTLASVVHFLGGGP